MFTFEPDGIEDRKMTLSQGPSALVFAGFLSDGVSVLLVEQTPNAEGNGSSLTGTVRDLRQAKRRTLFSGLNYQRGSPVIMSKDQKKLYFVAKPGTGNTEGITEVDLAKGTNRLIKTRPRRVQ